MADAINETLKERGDRYGDFTEHALLAQYLKEMLRAFRVPPDGHRPWSKLSPDKKQALEVIMDKIARILNGDPEYKDNWHDIAGYATLAEQRCKP